MCMYCAHIQTSMHRDRIYVHVYMYVYTLMYISHVWTPITFLYSTLFNYVLYIGCDTFSISRPPLGHLPKSLQFTLGGLWKLQRHAWLIECWRFQARDTQQRSWPWYFRHRNHGSFRLNPSITWGCNKNSQTYGGFSKMAEATKLPGPKNQGSRSKGALATEKIHHVSSLHVSHGEFGAYEIWFSDKRLFGISKNLAKTCREEWHSQRLPIDLLFIGLLTHAISYVDSFPSRRARHSVIPQFAIDPFSRPHPHPS